MLPIARGRLFRRRASVSNINCGVGYQPPPPPPPPPPPTIRRRHPLLIRARRAEMTSGERSPTVREPLASYPGCAAGITKALRPWAAAGQHQWKRSLSGFRP